MSSDLRPPETVALRQCPNPVDGRKAFITRLITFDHCDKLQKEGFHACGGCVHARPETAAHRHAAINSLLGLNATREKFNCKVGGADRGLELSAARTWPDLEEAYCLIFRSFQNQGVPETGPVKLRIDSFNRIGGARTLLIHSTGMLIGALTILPDSVLGLPADELYHAELKALRQSGRKLCGFTSLAIETPDKDLARWARLHLFRAAWRYARSVLKATDICVLVPANHELYYRKLIMFEQLGEPRIYALGRQHSPAIGLRLNLDLAPKYFKTAYDGKEGAENLYHFFVKQDVRTLNGFLKKTQDAATLGQIGGPGFPSLLTPRPKA